MRRVTALCLVTFLVLAIGPVSVLAQGIKVPTAAEAVRLALVNSTEAAAARAELEAALAGDIQLRSALLGWRFDAVLDDTLSQSESLKHIEVDALNTLTGTIAVRKALTAHGTTRLALDESRIQLARAQREYTDQMRQIAVTAYEAYRQLELALIQYRVLQRAVTLTQDALDVARDQHRAGALAPARVQEAWLNHQEALSRQETARRMLDIA